MVKIKIYIEGGGEGKDLDKRFREAWTKFFKAAELPRMPGTVRGKGRGNTYDLFRTAIKAKQKDVLPLLLLDSEDPVKEGHTVWQHLKVRDDMDRPAGAQDNQAYLMVQVMETWFLADQENLQAFFGPKFKSIKILEWPNLEDVKKVRIFECLDEATQDCNKKYEKGKISFKVLETTNPKKVENACPHAKALLDFLRRQ